MTLYRKRSWWCDGCGKWHSVNARDVEAGSRDAGSWCGPSVRRAIREGRNTPLPGFQLDAFKREMGLI